MRIDKQSGMQQSRNFNAAAKDKAKVLEKMATGKRINRASDDAAGLAIAVEFSKQMRAFQTAGQNIAAGVSAMAIGDGSAATITEMLQRQRELAMQSSNGTLNADQRKAVDREFQSLSQEIDRVSKSAQYNGQNVADGTSKLSDGTGKVQTGDASGGVDLPHTDMSLATLNMGTQSVDSLAGAEQALNAIDSAMRKVSSQRAGNGATQNRLEHALQNIDNQMVNTAKGLSNIADLDYAKSTTDLVRASILQESNAAALTQFNNLSRSHLLALLQ